MKLNNWVLSIVVLILLVPASNLNGQDKKQNYGKAPDEIFPYQRFQKAYIYHFLVPLQFTGAGREKPAPTDLKEVRIGFLGPLEGSVIVSLGKQMLQGATLALEEANKTGGYKGIPFKLMIHNDVGLWGAAANEVLRLVEGDNGFFLLMHDDVALEPGAVRLMVEELYRTNAGMVGPELVLWDRPGTPKNVGLGGDRIGGGGPRGRRPGAAGLRGGRGASG